MKLEVARLHRPPGHGAQLSLEVKKFRALHEGV